MLSQERQLELESEAQRLREKYKPVNKLITVPDLERIAKEEYNVAAFYSPLVWPSIIGLTKEEGLVIEYFAYFAPYLKLTLGHEIGHVAAGHFDYLGPLTPTLRRFEDAEADYFSVSLNQVSLEYLNWCRDKEVLKADHMLSKAGRLFFKADQYVRARLMKGRAPKR